MGTNGSSLGTGRGPLFPRAIRTRSATLASQPRPSLLKLREGARAIAPAGLVLRARR